MLETQAIIWVSKNTLMINWKYKHYMFEVVLIYAEMICLILIKNLKNGNLKILSS